MNWDEDEEPKTEEPLGLFFWVCLFALIGLVLAMAYVVKHP